MQLNENIRPVTPEDLPFLKAVIDANDLFPSDMLDDTISDYFNNQNSKDFWLTYEDRLPVAIAYCIPEKMTEGTWNLLLIAVHRDYQGKGYGTSILHHVEHLLAERGERLLLVETSSLDDFERSRDFYLTCGYETEARIREFYQPNEDKIVFRKLLTSLK